MKTFVKIRWRILFNLFLILLCFAISGYESRQIEHERDLQREHVPTKSQTRGFDAGPKSGVRKCLGKDCENEDLTRKHHTSGSRGASRSNRNRQSLRRRHGRHDHPSIHQGHQHGGNQKNRTEHHQHNRDNHKHHKETGRKTYRSSHRQERHRTLQFSNGDIILESDPPHQTGKGSHRNPTKNTSRSRNLQMIQNRGLIVDDSDQQNEQGKHHQVSDLQISPVADGNGMQNLSPFRYRQPYGYRRRYGYGQRQPAAVTRLEQRMRPKLNVAIRNLKQTMSNILQIMQKKVKRVSDRFMSIHSDARSDISEVKQQLKFIHDENNKAYDALLDVTQLVRFVHLRAYEKRVAPASMSVLPNIYFEDFSRHVMVADQAQSRAKSIHTMLGQLKSRCMAQEREYDVIFKSFKSRDARALFIDIARYRRKIETRLYGQIRGDVRQRIHTYTRYLNGVTDKYLDARNYSFTANKEIRAVQRDVQRNIALRNAYIERRPPTDEVLFQTSAPITNMDEVEQIATSTYQRSRQLSRTVEAIARAIIPILQKAKQFIANRRESGSNVRLQLMAIIGRLANTMVKLDQRMDELRLLLGDEAVLRERCEDLVAGSGDGDDEDSVIDCEQYIVITGSGGEELMTTRRTNPKTPPTTMTPLPTSTTTTTTFRPKTTASPFTTVAKTSRPTSTTTPTTTTTLPPTTTTTTPSNTPTTTTTTPTTTTPTTTTMPTTTPTTTTTTPTTTTSTTTPTTTTTTPTTTTTTPTTTTPIKTTTTPPTTPDDFDTTTDDDDIVISGDDDFIFAVSDKPTTSVLQSTTSLRTSPSPLTSTTNVPTTLESKSTTVPSPTTTTMVTTTETIEIGSGNDIIGDVFEETEEKTTEDSGGWGGWWVGDDPYAGINRNLFNDKLQKRAEEEREISDRLMDRSIPIDRRHDIMAERWDTVTGNVDILRYFVNNASEVNSMWIATSPEIESTHTKIAKLSAKINANDQKIRDRLENARVIAETELQKAQGNQNGQEPSRQHVKMMTDLLSKVDTVRSNMRQIKEITSNPGGQPCLTVQKEAITLRNSIAVLREKIDRARAITSALPVTLAVENGHQYTAKVSSTGESLSPMTSLQVCIKPERSAMTVASFHGNGTVAYDIEIVDSAPVVSVTGSDGEVYGTIQSSVTMETSNWYNLHITRTGHTVEMRTTKLGNDTESTLEATAFPTMQALQRSPTTVQVSGSPNQGSTDVSGCVGSVIVNGQGVGLASTSNISQPVRTCTAGCGSSSSPSMVFTGDGYVMFPLSVLRPYYRVYSLFLKFSTRQREGILLLHNDQQQQLQMLLSVSEGFIHMEARTKRGTTVLRSQHDTYADGSFHFVDVNVQTDEIEANIDGVPDTFKAETSTQEIPPRTEDGIYVGGLGSTNQIIAGKTKLRPLTGCVSELRITERDIPMYMLQESKNVVYGSCTDSLWHHCVQFVESSTPVPLEDLVESTRIYVTVSTGALGTVLNYKRKDKFNINVDLDTAGVTISESLVGHEEMLFTAQNHDDRWMTLVIEDLANEVRVSLNGTAVSVQHKQRGWLSLGADVPAEYHITIGGEQEDAVTSFTGGLARVIVNDKFIDLASAASAHNLHGCERIIPELPEMDKDMKPVC